MNLKEIFYKGSDVDIKESIENIPEELSENIPEKSAKETLEYF